MLRFEDIHHAFGSRTVLHGLGHAFDPGVVALRGPNGIGKSTLLRVLAGVLEPDGGRVWIEGHALHADPAAAKARLSWVPDACPVYPFVTGRKLLDFVAYAKRCAVSDEVLGIVERFGLARHLGTRCGDMSLGTQKKLLLAAAWIGAPSVLLLDEPSNGLDADARAVLVELLRAKGSKALVLVSSHDGAFAEALGATAVEFERLGKADELPADPSR